MAGVDDLMIGRVLEPFGLSSLQDDFKKQITFVMSKGHDEFKATISTIHFNTKDNIELCEAMKAKCINVFSAKKVFGK